MKRLFLFTFLGLLLLLIAGCVQKFSSAQSEQVRSVEIAETEQISQISENAQKEENEILKDGRYGVVPVLIEIPAIEVKTKIEHVGTLADGRMDVPKDADNVGWYKPGTLPGEPGNAVMAGHVDDLTSPAVFYHLDKLKKGDKIYITGKLGETLTFEVYEANVYPRKEAPIEEIFGFTYRSALNLITCTGEYDEKTTERADRLVVSAQLIETEYKKS